MIVPPSHHLFYCNGYRQTKKTKINCKKQYLDYENDGVVRLEIPSFVMDLPDRLIDLLEIASYIYVSDRLASRGGNDLIEYHSWARDMKYKIKVRDINFWKQSKIKKSLSSLLCFMTGDKSYTFNFDKLTTQKPMQPKLFQEDDLRQEYNEKVNVVLFSGGLDSLSGIIDTLETKQNEKICLVSHQPGSPSITRTQDQLFEALKNHDKYRNQIVGHIKLNCGLKETKAKEESQRTRSFLFLVFAFIVAYFHKQKTVTVFENGITSLNFPKRQDMINARASRTTHPKNLKLMEIFFNSFFNSPISVDSPYLWLTKSDVIQKLKAHNQLDLLTSSVSCSHVRMSKNGATHCGKCPQCIDRRIAVYSSETQDYDQEHYYAYDFKEKLTKTEDRTNVLDYVRQSYQLRKQNIDDFYAKKLTELSDIIDYINGEDEYSIVKKVFNLFKRHSNQVFKGIDNIITKFQTFSDPPEENSFIRLICSFDYTKPEVKLLIKRIEDILSSSIPKAFRTEKPKNEVALQDHIKSILDGEKGLNLRREFPSIPFACSTSRPDFSDIDNGLLIEIKYIRGKTVPSKVNKEIAEDITKYGTKPNILFIVYDPERKITDEFSFTQDIRNYKNCDIHIYR